ncbi:MAG: hypothetical protein V7711_07145 [Pseudomonadales bacterium]
MYTDEDLNTAIDKGIFTANAVEEFRIDYTATKNMSVVDEENFRLIGGFNDIFVVIACLILLFSASQVVGAFNETLASFLGVAISWGLAEFFVRKRKMSLPAIVLLLAFVTQVFYAILGLFETPSEMSIALATAATAAAAWFHWRRFRVPITIAAGAAAVTACIVASILYMFPVTTQWVLPLILLGGILVFCLAMYWDTADRERTGYQSDVAFWLHLLSAPLIVHPVFSSLGILDGTESVFSIAIVIALYGFMTLISVVIDRRAFMVSSLVYVLYAFSNLLEVYGVIGYNFAVTGVCISVSLLLLTAFWHKARVLLVMQMPAAIQQRVPTLK